MKFILFFLLIAVGQYAEVTCFVPFNYGDILSQSIRQLRQEVDETAVDIQYRLYTVAIEIFANAIFSLRDKAHQNYVYLVELINYYKEALLCIKNNPSQLLAAISNITITYERQKGGVMIVKLKNQGEQVSEDKSFESSKNDGN